MCSFAEEAHAAAWWRLPFVRSQTANASRRHRWLFKASALVLLAVGAQAVQDTPDRKTWFVPLPHQPSFNPYRIHLEYTPKVNHRYYQIPHLRYIIQVGESPPRWVLSRASADRLSVAIRQRIARELEEKGYTPARRAEWTDAIADWLRGHSHVEWDLETYKNYNLPGGRPIEATDHKMSWWDEATHEEWTFSQRSGQVSRDQFMTFSHSRSYPYGFIPPSRSELEELSELNHALKGR